MRSLKFWVATAFLVAAIPVFGVELPCWDKPSCYDWSGKGPKLPSGLIPKRPDWHKSLDDVSLRMRQDADYSILWNSGKDRIPFIHTPESQRAVDELAGSVLSSIASPLTYRLSLFPDFEMRRQKLNTELQGAMPEMRSGYYSVHFLPRVDFSQTNPVSLDVKLKDGKELGVLSVRIHETEITAPISHGVFAVGGYSFRDSSWYVYLAGKIPMPW